jgi:site-specific recombinase XerD
MLNTPDSIVTFIRHIQLKSLRPRTCDSYVHWVLAIAKHFSVLCPALLSEPQVLEFLHHLQQQRGLKGSTLNQAVCALRAFYRDHLKRQGWTCWGDIKIKRSYPLPVVLSRGEVSQLLSVVCEPRFQALFSLIYHTGLRADEAACIEVSHLDRRRGVLRVMKGKGGKVREVPMTPEMFDRLGAWWLRHRNPRYLFPGTGQGWNQKGMSKYEAMGKATHPMSSSSIQMAMRAAVTSSGLTKKGITTHTLRHSYATHLVEENVPLRQVQAYMGHHSIEVTAIYLHLTEVSETKAQDAILKLYQEVIPSRRVPRRRSRPKQPPQQEQPPQQ